MKIRFKDKRQWGQTINIPYDGLVTIGPAGITEVSDRAANLLLNKSTDWEEAEPQKAPVKKSAKATEKAPKSAKKTTKKPKPEPEPEPVEEEEVEVDEVEDTATDDEDADGLDDMDLENLINIAETSAIAGWEKFQHNEKALRTFLKNRLKS